MVGSSLVGRPKKKPPESKLEPRSLAFRASGEYAAWAERLAKHNRSTIAGLIEQAMVKFARDTGFTEEAPER